jgi:hypothetical protein
MARVAVHLHAMPPASSGPRLPRLSHFNPQLTRFGGQENQSMPRANASAARTWPLRQAQNAGRPCLVPGCHRERRSSSVDPCCATHARRRGLLGDPRLRALSRVDMRPWIARARAFIAENHDHAGIQRGIELLDALLARYVDLANGDRYRRFNVARRRQISAIAEAAMQGMTGEDLLPRCRA